MHPKAKALFKSVERVGKNKTIAAGQKTFNQLHTDSTPFPWTPPPPSLIHFISFRSVWLGFVQLAFSLLLDHLVFCYCLTLP